MRYLAVAELEQLNALLSSVESDDGSRITGRLEAYSCTWREVGEGLSGTGRQGGGGG